MFKTGINYLSDGGDEDVQIIKDKKSGPREHDLLDHNDFGNLTLGYSRESGKHEGESGVMC